MTNQKIVGHLQNGTNSALYRRNNSNTPLISQQMFSPNQSTNIGQRRSMKLNVVTQGLKVQEPNPTYNLNDDDVLHIEDYYALTDNKFVQEELTPYLKDLYKDLLIRSNQVENIDKVTFIEYTKLPGIINDRLHYMFSAQQKDN